MTDCYPPSSWRRNLPLSAMAIVGILLGGLTLAFADECDATAGELTARVHGVAIIRRSTVAIYFSHPALKYGSVGCLGGKTKNVFTEIESMYPQASYFSLIGAIGSLVLAGSSEDIRESAVLCQKKALLKANEDVTVDHAGYSYQCSADRMSSSLVVQRN